MGYMVLMVQMVGSEIWFIHLLGSYYAVTIIKIKSEYLLSTFVLMYHCTI